MSLVSGWKIIQGNTNFLFLKMWLTHLWRPYGGGSSTVAPVRLFLIVRISIWLTHLTLVDPVTISLQDPVVEVHPGELQLSLLDHETLYITDPPDPGWSCDLQPAGPCGGGSARGVPALSLLILGLLCKFKWPTWPWLTLWPSASRILWWRFIQGNSSPVSS